MLEGLSSQLEGSEVREERMRICVKKYFDLIVENLLNLNEYEKVVFHL